LTHYRVPLFQSMRETLAGNGIQLRLLVGSGTSSEEMKRDSGSLDWAETLTTQYFSNGRICWQPYGKLLDGASLVVIPQENGLLYNQRMLWLPRRAKLAFWGHGANFQSERPNGLRERYKAITLHRADWWFAYTEATTRLLNA